MRPDAQIVDFENELGAINIKHFFKCFVIIKSNTEWFLLDLKALAIACTLSFYVDDIPCDRNKRSENCYAVNSKCVKQ